MYKHSAWKALTFDSEPDWQKAAKIVEDRISGRFVRWIDRVAGEKYSGFAVVALDCMLIETLYGFQVGRSSKKTKSIYISMLTRPRFAFDPETAESFYCHVRHGLFHDTETRGKWLIEITRPPTGIFARSGGGEFVLNRVSFHAALKSEFNDWIEKLRGGDQVARGKMRTRMDELIGRHFEV